MLPIYTNYLSPADYGIAGFLVFYVSLAQILLGGKLEQAISKFYYDKNILHPLSTILTTATVFTLVISSVPLIIGLLLSTEISTLLFDSPSYQLAVCVVSLNIVFGTTELYGLQYIKIVDKPKTYLALNLLKLSLQLTINIVLIVFLDQGIIGVVVSSAAASIVLTMVSAILVYINEPTITFERTLIRPLFTYSAPLWVAGLIGLYSGSIHQVFIKMYASFSELGLYNLAATFGGLVGTLAWTPFFNFWSVERFRIYEEINSRKTYKAVFYWSAGISLFLCFGISVFSDPVIRIMANEAFHPASAAVAPLTIFTTVMYLIWHLNFSFLVTNNNKELARNGFVYALLISGAYLLLIPKWGYTGAAYGLMIGNIINLHIIEYRARIYYDIGVSIIKIDMMIILTLILIWIFSKINAFFISPFIAALSSLIAIVLLLLVITVILYRLHPETYRPLLSKFNPKLKGCK